MTTTTTKTIELKNVKIYAGMSEETTAFDATLYIDGKRRCGVSNRGHGDPIAFDDWEVFKELNEYGKTLPVETHTLSDGATWTSQPDAESLVGDALSKWESTQWLKRQTRNKILFRVEGDGENEYRSYKISQQVTRAAVKSLIERTYGDKVIEIHGV